MSLLVPTLATQLAQALALFASGRIGVARSALEDLIEKAQERHDPSTEVTSRSVLARCHLRRGDHEQADVELQQAKRKLSLDNIEACGHYRAALVRLSLASASRELSLKELHTYRTWAETVGAAQCQVDALLLLTEHGPTDEQMTHLQLAAEVSRLHRLEPQEQTAWTKLGTLLEQQGELDEALNAYQQAASCAKRQPHPEFSLTRSLWLVGATACRLEDWPLAREVLEEAIASDPAPDIHALCLADLALAHEAAGDVVQARHLIIQAMKLAKETELAFSWPARWQAMLEHAKRLELVNS